jgi:hypothetical protein
MTEYKAKDEWLDNLSSALKDRALKESGLIAYKWNVLKDSFEWVGAFGCVTGMDISSYPKNSREFYALINPQYLPEKIKLIHTLLEQYENDQEAMPKAQIIYPLMQSDGRFIEILESAELHINPQTGEKIMGQFARRILVTTLTSQKDHHRGVVSLAQLAQRHRGLRVAAARARHKGPAGLRKMRSVGRHEP